VDLDALNTPELVRDTPIGDLVVKRFGGVQGVGVCHWHVPEKSPRLIHVVDPTKRGGGVLDAIYGKRFWECDAVVEVHARAQEVVDKRLERNNALVSADLTREMETLINRRGDEAREAIIFGRR